MNNTRRKKVKQLLTELKTVSNALCDLQNQEAEAIKKTPKNLMHTEKVTQMKDDEMNLGFAVSDLESVFDDLSVIIQ